MSETPNSKRGPGIATGRIALAVLSLIGIGALLRIAEGDRLAYIVSASAIGVGLAISILIARRAAGLMDKWEVSTAAIVGVGLIVLKSGLIYLEAGAIGFLVGVGLGWTLALKGEDIR